MNAKKRRKRRQLRSDYQVGPGMLVKVAYELCDAEGELVEASDDGAPLELLVGYGEVAPALERALDGLSVGEGREVVMGPKDGFGLRDPAGFIEVDAADLPEGLEPGDEFVAEREGGGEVPLKVVEVLPDVVVLDTNHPLAGQRVRLRVRVLQVNPAAPERILRATERLADAPATPRALLPASQLLRRKPPKAAVPDDEPPPRPTRVA